MADYEGMRKAILEGDEDRVAELVEAAIKEGVSPEQILNEGLLKGMSVVGDLFKRDELFVPEVIFSSKAMKRGTAILQPLMAGDKQQTDKVVLLGTVKGDIHDIGKNLVKTLMEGSGFAVTDLGIDIPSEMFIEKARELKPHIVAMSALLTTTMVHMKDVIDGLKEAGLRDQIKIIVGGAPITRAFAAEIGADGTAPDAVTAADLARELVG
ncbi:MAG: corrinoid protein [Chloroflexi bacterium]|nr:corrinoid protein [Chloroflexota bacterium]